MVIVLQVFLTASYKYFVNILKISLDNYVWTEIVEQKTEYLSAKHT